MGKQKVASFLVNLNVSRVYSAYTLLRFTRNAVTFLFFTQFQNPFNDIKKNDDSEKMASVYLG